MTPSKPGDVVAVEFPFTDFQTFKRRPGLDLAASESDLLVARLTTHPARDSSDVKMQRWSEAGLPRASTIRLTKMVTIDARLVHHRIGRLHSDDAHLVVQAWQRMAVKFAAEAAK
jgi:mRNA interferase MazF